MPYPMKFAKNKAKIKIKFQKNKRDFFSTASPG